MTMKTSSLLRLCLGIAIALLFLATIALAVAVENMDPGDDDAQYAWSENAGWLNAEPLGDGGPGVEVTTEWISGWLWGENIGWISLSCANTSSCGTIDFGVTNDGCGVLDGFAWSENGGWIDFRPSSGGVFVDPETGEFSGEAWSENVGWISFSSSGLAGYRMVTAWRAEPVPGFVELDVDKSIDVAILSWLALPGALGYDIAWGDIGDLLSTGGDFSAASFGCLIDDWHLLTYEHAKVPPPGTGFWYLVRGEGCGPAGTYDADSGAQSSPRDSRLDQHPSACS